MPTIKAKMEAAGVQEIVLNMDLGRTGSLYDLMGQAVRDGTPVLGGGKAFIRKTAPYELTFQEGEYMVRYDLR